MPRRYEEDEQMQPARRVIRRKRRPAEDVNQVAPDGRRRILVRKPRPQARHPDEQQEYLDEVIQRRIRRPQQQENYGDDFDDLDEVEPARGMRQHRRKRPVEEDYQQEQPERCHRRGHRQQEAPDYDELDDHEYEPRRQPRVQHEQAREVQRRPRRKAPVEPVEDPARRRENEALKEAMRLLRNSPPTYGEPTVVEDGVYGNLANVITDEDLQEPELDGPDEDVEPEQPVIYRRRREFPVKPSPPIGKIVPTPPAVNNIIEDESDSVMIPMPDWMRFAGRIEEDASSRDFFFIHPDKVPSHMVPSPVRNIGMITVVPEGAESLTADRVQKRSFLKTSRF